MLLVFNTVLSMYELNDIYYGISGLIHELMRLCLPWSQWLAF